MIDRTTQRYDLARAIAHRHFGNVRDVIHQPYGHAGITFHLKTDEGDFILKTTDVPGAYNHTAHNIDVLRGLDIPVPKLVAHGQEGEITYLIAERIPGRDLGHELAGMSRPQMATLAKQIVEIQRKVSTLPEDDGFGWAPIGVPGPFKSWTDIVLRDSKGRPASIRERVDSMRPYLDSVPPTCFLDDITVKNVIVEDGELRGIVDLDSVCYGDPLYMLSLTETTVVLDVGFEATFYLDELKRHWKMSPIQVRANSLYVAMHCTHFLARDLEPDQRTRMEKLLAHCVRDL